MPRTCARSVDALDDGRSKDDRRPEAYLGRIVTNAALDRLRSAQSRREQYVGPYILEPLMRETEGGPLQSAQLADEPTLPSSSCWTSSIQ